MPVAEGELIVREQAKFLRATGGSSAMIRELSVTAIPTVAVYGATERLALFGIFPYLDKELDVTTPMGRASRGVSGIGDITFLARYTARQWDSPGETKRLAPFFGLKVPTGDDDETDSLGKLPQPLQLGSGSWDPIVGSVFTWQTLDWQLDTSASYQFKSEANDFEFGDIGRLNAAFKYRLWPGNLETVSEGVPGFIYGALETNLIWQDRNEALGAGDPNSGGFTWFLAPGIQYVTRRVIFEAAIQLPVVQKLHGNALETDYIVTVGFRVKF